MSPYEPLLKSGVEKTAATEEASLSGGGIEAELLAHMTTPEGLAVVVEKNLGPDVFEKPINQYAFTKVLKYWNSYKKAPAREVLLQEVPGLKVPEPDDYATGWLIEKLQKRYATNRVQEMVRQAVKTHVDDPFGTMKLLATQATEEAKSVSADRFYTDVAAMLADGLPEQPRPAVLSRTDGWRCSTRARSICCSATPRMARPGSAWLPAPRRCERVDECWWSTSTTTALGRSSPTCCCWECPRR